MMIILILIAGILAGMAIPVQTSINSRLGMKIGSPYGRRPFLFVGTLLLLIVALVTERHFCLSSDLFLPFPGGSSLEADV